TASDRDRLLGAIYRHTFGTKIDSTETCTRCGSPFDLSLSLDELANAIDAGAAASSVQRLDTDIFQTDNGVRFRRPTAREEIAAVEDPSVSVEEAARRLAAASVLQAPEDVGVDAVTAVEEAIEEVAPVMDLDITTACPECGASQVLRF